MSKTCEGTDSIKPNDFIACASFLFGDNLFSSKMFLNSLNQLLSSCTGPTKCGYWSRLSRPNRECGIYGEERECVYNHINALRTRIPRGMTNKDITKILLRCKDRGDLSNPIRGLYRLPKSDMKLDELLEKYLNATYIYNAQNRYYNYKERCDRIGYSTGVSLIRDFNPALADDYYNKQLSSKEICSNVCSERRTPTRHKYDDLIVCIHRPRILVNNENYPYLEFLDLISLLKLKDVKIYTHDLRIHARIFQKKTCLKDQDFLLRIKKYCNSYPKYTYQKLLLIFPELKG